jgi:hypothetical protein
MLRLEIGELQEIGFDIGLIGFNDAEIAALAIGETTGLTDPDEVPEVPAEPVSRLGDLWVLGRHRLLCGDSTDPTAVKTVLGNVRPHLMVTDPPYGVEYDPAWRRTPTSGRARRSRSAARQGAASATTTRLIGRSMRAISG